MKLFYFRTIIIYLICSGLVHGAAGDLDTSLGGTGTLRLGFGQGEDYGRVVAVQADGKFVVAGSSGLQQYSGGHFALVRFTTNNVLDPTFGTAGRVVTTIGVRSAINALRIQADGKIVAGGYNFDASNNHFTLARYNTNGTLDVSFGTGGIVVTDFIDNSQINGMVLQGDGKIVAAGGVAVSFNSDFGLARYLTNGALDPAFGTGGKIVIDAAGDAWANSVILQADGKILASGTGGGDFATLRFNTNGVLDTSWGGTGKVYTRLANYGANVSEHYAAATGVAYQFGDFTIQNPDKIVVSGYVEVQFARNVYGVVRYSLAGVLDSTFGNGGVVTNAVAGNDSPQALLVQGILNQPRKVIVGGYSSIGSTNVFSIARFNANGSLDSTFGGGTGKAAFALGTNHDDECFGMVFQSGRIVMSGSTIANNGNGDFAVLRLNSDGTRDLSFDSDGVITADIADRTSHASAVAVQPDGKILATGGANNGSVDVLALARLNPDGSLDPSFGDLGRVLGPASLGASGGTAIALQSDGKILVAGSATGNGADFVLLRYQTNGVLDPSFNGTGMILTSFGTGTDEAHAIAFQSDGKILLAGYSSNPSDTDFAVARYNANGTPDTSFNGSGKVTVAIGTGNDQATSVQVQNDGKIVLAGYGLIGTTYQVALVRLNANGTLDNTFGSFGRVATPIGNGTYDVGLAMVLQPDRKIVVAGYSLNPSTGDGDIAVLRYLTNGSLDATFDGDGKVTTPVGISVDLASSLALQPDGKIVVGGATRLGAYLQFASVRYQTNGALDGTYGFNGKVAVDLNDGGDNIANALALDSLGRPVLVGDANGCFGLVRLLGDPFIRIQSVSRLPNTHVLLQGIGVPGAGHSVYGAPTVKSGYNVVGATTADAAGHWQFEDVPPPSATNRFYYLTNP